MDPKSHALRAAELAAKMHSIHEPVTVDQAEAADPKSGKPVYRFKVVSAAHANRPANIVFLDHRGEPLEPTHELAALFDHPVGKWSARVEYRDARLVPSRRRFLTLGSFFEPDLLEK